MVATPTLATTSIFATIYNYKKVVQDMNDLHKFFFTNSRRDVE